MKTMKMILAGVLLMLPLLCQAQKNLFNKYGDMKGVSSVYISKAMIETNPNLFTKDVYIGKVSGQLNSVQVLSTMDNNVKKEMRKDLRSLVQSSRYELLMKQKGTVSSSEFYMSRKGEKVKELIMIVDGAATLKFVYLEGDMTLKDIQNIMMYQNTSWNGNNVNIQLPDINWAEIEKLKNRDWLGELKHSQELALKGLENVAKLKDNKYLKEQMDTDTWKRFEKSMEAFINAGVKVLVTELDLSVLPWPKGNYGAAIETNFDYKIEMVPYTDGLPAEKAKELDDFYIKLFDIYLRHSKDIGRVTFWGVTDGDSWKNNFPVHGRTDYPLAFGRDMKPKPFVRTIIEMAQSGKYD